jgi:hypothetical protein
MNGNTILGSGILISKHPHANTYAFSKRDDKWLVGQQQDFDLNDEFTKVIDFIARGRRSMKLTIDTEPLAGSHTLHLIQFGSLCEGGGYYRLLNPIGKLELSGIWLCDFLLHILGDIPEFIYVRCSSDSPNNSLFWMTERTRMVMQVPVIHEELPGMEA